MSDPFDRTPMPGFPSLGSQHAVPPHLRDPRANQLRPAISAADAERGGRTPFGPPPNGWPLGKDTLSPIKQRTVDGISALMGQAAPALPGPLQIGVGAMLGAVRQQIAKQTDDDTAHMLDWIITRLIMWRSGMTELETRQWASEHNIPTNPNDQTDESDTGTPVAE